LYPDGKESGPSPTVPVVGTTSESNEAEAPVLNAVGCEAEVLTANQKDLGTDSELLTIPLNVFA